MAKYKLRLKRLDFVSVVDTPAQEPATCLLIKRAGNKHEIEATAKFVKADSKLGLAFFWAVTDADEQGNPYHDLQGDQVIADDDLVKSAMDFMERGGAVDQQHDSAAIGKTVFAMPMTPDIAKAYGITTKRHGLMVAVKPAPDVLAKLESGEYTGVSIAGIGEREKVAAVKAKTKPSPLDHELEDRLQTLLGGMHDEDVKDVGTLADAMHADSSYDDNDDETAKRLRKSRFSVLSDKLAAKGADDPDALAAYIGRKKYGSAAMARMAARGRRKKSARKSMQLTTAEAGHVHLLDDDGSEAGETDCRSMPGVADGGYHSHPWIRVDGKIVIGEADGHDHEVADLAGAPDDDEDDANKRAPISTPPNTQKQGGPMKPIVLTEREHAHYSKLSDADREAFVSKSAAEREAIVKAALDADPIVFKGEVTGVEVRKSHGDLAKKLAEQNEAMAKRHTEQDAEIAKAKAERETEVLKARAKAELAHFPGTDEAKAELLKRIGDDAKLVEMHKAADAMLATLAQAHGVTTDNTIGPVAEFNAKHAEYAKSVNKTTAACAAEFVATPEGSRLYKAAFPHTAN